MLLHSRNLVSEPLQYLGRAVQAAAGGQTGFRSLRPLARWRTSRRCISSIAWLLIFFDRWVGLTAALLLGISFGKSSKPVRCSVWLVLPRLCCAVLPIQRLANTRPTI